MLELEEKQQKLLQNLVESFSPDNALSRKLDYNMGIIKEHFNKISERMIRMESILIRINNENPYVEQLETEKDWSLAPVGDLFNHGMIEKRISNILSDHDYTASIGNLCQQTERRLLSMDRIKTASVKVIKDKLATIGMALKEY